ncbi:MAG: SpoIVB peptidase [Clostridia bacterium]|nr:SpoIVB peptidase [Clostridia bacterium]
MKKRIWKLLCCFLLMITAAQSGAVTIMADTPQKEIVFAMSNQVTEPLTLPATSTALSGSVLSDTVATLSADDLQDLYLYPGGMPFGVKFYTEGVTVVGVSDVETEKGTVNPATEAGLRTKDVILKVDGEVLSGASELTDRIENCNGNALNLICRRGSKTFETTLKPVYCKAEARYKTGIWVRDSGAGIGTVTFILPDTGAFAGLGHGICDADTGSLISMKRGSVSDVTISAVVRGESGKPGELKGYFNAGKVGALLGNSSCGVWGMFSEVPDCTAEPLPVGLKGELEEGDAYILCTLDNNKTEKYDVRISNIHPEATGSKCFTVTVTDPDLLAVTGGIVQGMSGSPIIQNGKLVGAVTHVLINDPTTGYGIFIENMLVNMPLMAR